jgi:hypothetical protein
MKRTKREPFSGVEAIRPTGHSSHAFFKSFDQQQWSPLLPEKCSAAWPTTKHGRKRDTILKRGIDCHAQNTARSNTNTALAIYLQEMNKLPRASSYALLNHRGAVRTLSLSCSQRREHKACWFSRAQVPKENIRDAVSELSVPAEPSKTLAPVRSRSGSDAEEQTVVFIPTLGESS